MYRLFKVIFNDGKWYSGDLPSILVIAKDQEIAIQKAIKEKPYYNERDTWAEEIELDGYEIIINKID